MKSATIKSDTSSPFTTRLQKGGALFADMRQLVIAAARDSRAAASAEDARAVLTKTTAARLNDIYVRAFRPRFIEGSPPEAWRLAAAIESLSPDESVVRPFYYWITARAEPVLYSFVSTELFARLGGADRDVRIGEVIVWIENRLNIEEKSWTRTVQHKVARGMLAALRDFGVLEGASRKRLAALHLAPEAFALIAFLLRGMGVEGGSLISHPDWRLFLFTETVVERLFLECHQRHWLRYEVAGAIHRIEFPERSFKEYVNELLSPGD
jgi:hypothetical protein